MFRRLMTKNQRNWSASQRKANGNPPVCPLPFDYRTDVVLSVCFTGRIWDSVRIKGLRGRPLIIEIAERHCWSDQVQRVRFCSRLACGLLSCALCTSNFNLSRPWFVIYECFCSLIAADRFHNFPSAREITSLRNDKPQVEFTTLPSSR